LALHERHTSYAIIINHNKDSVHVRRKRKQKARKFLKRKHSFQGSQNISPSRYYADCNPPSGVLDLKRIFTWKTQKKNYFHPKKKRRRRRRRKKHALGTSP
jgi:hypothetical protein